ncbi:uncharacterized protein UBRO_07332 [Ustilago bromivora]|uniref:Uncharacterized protein n=1 Tax=Ustilago bromivora TaxID=307758 RepID=A0A1K0GWQ7_9BASI|nr:uncharacterized protein UBRO_07332 [Ustilago bromivora]
MAAKAERKNPRLQSAEWRRKSAAKAKNSTQQQLCLFSTFGIVPTLVTGSLSFVTLLSATKIEPNQRWEGMNASEAMTNEVWAAIRAAPLYAMRWSACVIECMHAGQLMVYAAVVGQQMMEPLVGIALHRQQQPQHKQQYQQT